MDMSNKEVLLAVSSYKEKYFFNEIFKDIPKQVKKELIALGVKFVEDVGGIFLLGFYDNGNVFLESRAEENDYNYDEIGSQLNIKQMQNEKKELLTALTLWYNMVYRNKI